MVKLGLMVLMTGLGVAGGLVYAPFLPAAIYHFFAVLRPQFIWGNDLDPIVGPNFPWSLALALSAIVSAVVWRMSFWIAPHRYPGIMLPKLNIGHYLFGFFALWITASYLNGEQPASADRFFDDYRKIFLMFYVTSLVMVTARQVGLLHILITIGFVFIAFEDNQLYFLHGRYNFRDRTFAGLDNNGAALLLAMGVPLCVHAWDGIRHWIRWAFPFGILLIVHAVLISFSRGAMLALVATSPLYLMRCRNKKMIIAGYIVAAALVPVLASDQITARFATIKDSEKDASAQNRFTTWNIAWNMANERPLFGYGVRTSSLYTHKHGADEEGRVIHSTYLQIAADSGLVGLAAYLMFLGGAFYCAARASNLSHRVLKDTPNDGNALIAYSASSGVEGSLAVFVVGGAFLSLETFEPPYIVAMMAIQLWSIVQVQSRQVAEPTGSA